MTNPSTHKKNRILAALSGSLLGLLALPAPASAQEAKGWIVTLGPGAALVPKYPGAKKDEIRFWPIVDVRRAGSEPRFETPDDSFGISLVRSRTFRFGPALNIQRGRDEEDAILGIGDVGTSIEGGAFVEAFLADHFRLRGEVRKGFGGHKGWVADVGGDLILGRPVDRFHLSVGPRLRLADGKYGRAFYGVDAEQALATGLGPHDVDSGLHSVGALSFANFQLSPRLGIQGYARYDRLVGDVADSPLVRSAFGSRSQYEVGLGLTYSFNIG
ncbi:MipA/OmpV family protein [Sphingosinicella rhizophila]|uniref:MipA/OmpV family protein n=1 Tax=Sphingosinicella rhizophila TaxID=3050082 RepID=A0ABU3Q9M4_9SPHN|nr:MipA/OmpV family protein [Sphingosinicella sp. GR2756]MDT9600098.1 MipA/OmpV family protein [Sphingosinicella sp. GR2756]